MSGLPSVMSHSFSQVPRADIPRSTFDRSHGHKTTFDCDYLIPVFTDEVYPGDSMHLNMHAVARMLTPYAPIMDNMYLSSFFFAVPIRLLWSNWEHFNGALDDPGDLGTDYTVPKMGATGGGYSIGSLEDYFGLPTGIAIASGDHTCLYHRAYNLIWNEWFRDQNLQDSVVINKGDGPDAKTDYTLLRRGKRHDYFTSCLPWVQKSLTSVELPLGSSAPVIGNGSDLRVTTAGGATAHNLTARAADNLMVGVGFDDTAVRIPTTGDNGMIADLSSATAATINQIREAFQVQRLYERDARGGTRYTEIVRSHFGVSSPDQRLQRPEYLGGGRAPVVIHSITQTNNQTVGASVDGISNDVGSVGKVGGQGTAHVSGHGFTRSFTEHCLVVGLVSVNADLTYQRGLSRLWTRDTRFDFYWPALAHLGEQSVLNKEIYFQGAAGGTDDEEVFGYQERYAELRYKPSQITGLFRSTAAGTLEYWHLSQKFTSLPTLDSTFIVSDTPLDRCVAVPSQPHFIFDSWFEYKCARPMPVFGVPGMMDHF
jgi:hypothetical protein